MSRAALARLALAAAAVLWAILAPAPPHVGAEGAGAAQPPPAEIGAHPAVLEGCGALIKAAVMKTHPWAEDGYAGTMSGLVCLHSWNAGADPVKVSAIVSVESRWKDIGFGPSNGNYGPMQVNRCHLREYGDGFTRSLDENVRVGVNVFRRVGWSYARYNGGGSAGYAGRAAAAERRIREALGGASPWGESVGL